MIQPNSDNIAMRAQADIERFYGRVVCRTLGSLVPEPMSGKSVTNDLDEFLDRARIGTHNALCVEARNAFALTIGAAFERHLRLWLATKSPAERKDIQKQAGWSHVVARVSGLTGTDMAALPLAADAEELWLVVSAVRHGDGPSCTTLQSKAPQLWQHLTPNELREAIGDGVASFNMQVSDGDLSRYAHAILAFWGYLGATPFGRAGGRQGYYVPVAYFG